MKSTMIKVKAEKLSILEYHQGLRLDHSCLFLH